MKNIRSPYSIEYYDYYSDKSYYYIVMEKCDDNLDSFMEKNNSGLADSLINCIF